MLSKKILSIVNFLLFIGVVAVNALANILPINGYNTGELSDMYPNLFVPAGITFSIWGVIYLLLLILTVYNMYTAFKNDKRDLRLFNIVLGFNFILNILWILFWHYKMVPLSLVVMLFLLGTLLYMDNFLSSKIIHGLRDKIAFKLSISVYLGWISVATIANIVALLVSVNWNGFGVAQDFWAIFVIIAGTIISVLKLILHKNIPFALVFIWAYLGITIKRMATEPVYSNIINTTIVSILLISCFCVYAFITTKPKRLVI